MNSAASSSNPVITVEENGLSGEYKYRSEIRAHYEISEPTMRDWDSLTISSLPPILRNEPLAPIEYKLLRYESEPDPNSISVDHVFGKSTFMCYRTGLVSYSTITAFTKKVLRTRHAPDDNLPETVIKICEFVESLGSSFLSRPQISITVDIKFWPRHESAAAIDRKLGKLAKLGRSCHLCSVNFDYEGSAHLPFSCSHIYHGHCISPWLNCPVCESAAANKRLATLELSCPICLLDFDYEGGDWASLPFSCSHLYHMDCISQWLKTNNTCPLCRCPKSSSAS